MHNFPENVGVGYISISASAEESGFKIWKGYESLSASAERKMREVSELISQQIFWPPSEIVSEYDDFAAVCGVKQFEALSEEAESE
ncbi:MAG: hypothetical protein R3A13_04240 [Bdellovibrionota bacterium]